MSVKRIACLFVAVLLMSATVATAVEQTVGLFYNRPGSSNGYTLFSPIAYAKTYLISNDGLLVHDWESNYRVGNTAYILEDGHLLRTADPGSDYFVAGGDAGIVQEFDWDGALLWEFLYSNEQHRLHHDIEPLPNGNVLMIAFELRTFEECIAAGRDPALLSDNELWPDHIIEVEPVWPDGGNIVWEWHVWDHLIQDFDPTKANFGVVADHPELVDINFVKDAGADWLHTNAIDYNPELDQIVIGSPWLNEFWVIDHSTTTEEAAGHTGGNSGMGGDILYRWGNPQAYRAGTADDQTLWNQHGTNWIDAGLPGAGNVLIFNNGNGRPGGDYSSIDEIETTVDVGGAYPQPDPGDPHGPAAPTWTYTHDPKDDLFAGFLSGAQRQPNNNTLICVGVGGTFVEVTTEGDSVWLYVCPVAGNGPINQGDDPVGNNTFRAERYGVDFPGFEGRDLTPRGPIEGPVASVDGGLGVPRDFVLYPNRPNPFPRGTTLSFRLDTASTVVLRIYNVEGRHIETLVDGRLGAGMHRYEWNAEGKSNGLYQYTLKVGSAVESGTMVLLR